MVFTYEDVTRKIGGRECASRCGAGGESEGVGCECE